MIYAQTRIREKPSVRAGVKKSLDNNNTSQIFIILIFS